MIDANQVWEVDEAIEWVNALRDANPFWIEEPVSPDDILGHQRIKQAVSPINVATGEHAHNRIMFKQFLQADALDIVQFDNCRLASVNETLAVQLMASKFGKPVCLHAGGVGLCETGQHVAMIDFLCVSGTMDGRMLEHAGPLHGKFVNPIQLCNGRYMAPEAPGFSTEMKAGPRAESIVIPMARIGADRVPKRALRQRQELSVLTVDAPATDFVLDNGNVVLDLSCKGGAITRCEVPDIRCSIQQAPPRNRFTSRIFPSFPSPIASALASALLGKITSIPPNLSDPRFPLPIHGFGWQAEWDIERRSASEVALRYHALNPAWPAPFLARQVLTLTSDGYVHSISVTNTGDSAMPGGLGLHPYFPSANAISIEAGFSAHWHTGTDGLPVRRDPCRHNQIGLQEKPSIAALIGPEGSFPSNGQIAVSRSQPILCSVTPSYIFQLRDHSSAWSLSPTRLMQ